MASGRYARKMLKTHKLEFGVYHWDTFDNDTVLLREFDDLAEAVDYVKDRYGERLRDSGADRVEIVNSVGSVVRRWRVG